MRLILGTFLVSYLLSTLCTSSLSSFLLHVMDGTGKNILGLEMTMTLGMEIRQSEETRQRESLRPWGLLGAVPPYQPRSSYLQIFMVEINFVLLSCLSHCSIEPLLPFTQVN